MTSVEHEVEHKRVDRALGFQVPKLYGNRRLSNGVTYKKAGHGQQLVSETVNEVKPRSPVLRFFSEVQPHLGGPGPTAKRSILPVIAPSLTSNTTPMTSTSSAPITAFNIAFGVRATAPSFCPETPQGAQIAFGAEAPWVNSIMGLNQSLKLMAQVPSATQEDPNESIGVATTTTDTADRHSGYIVDELTLQDPSDPEQEIKRVMVAFTGESLKASDVLRTIMYSDRLGLTTQDKTGKVYEVAAYAFKLFIMDADLVLPGVNLAIIAPNWSIDSNKAIDLSGRSGRGPDPKPATPKTPDKYTIPPDHGADGKPGYPGESSGNLMIIGLSDNDTTKLTIKLNGGDGGGGQDAGNGGNAQKVEPEWITIDEKTGVISKYETYSAWWFWNKYKRTDKNLSAQPGGNTGRPGGGGLPGEAGVLYAKGSSLRAQREKGQTGSNGKAGDPGKGTIGYDEYTQVVMYGYKDGKYILNSYGPTPKSIDPVDGSILGGFCAPKRTSTPLPFRHWQHIISYVKEHRMALLEKIVTSGDEAADSDHVGLEELRKIAEFVGLQSFVELAEITYQLTIEEVSGLDKQTTLWLWQQFEKGVEEFGRLQKDLKSQTKANVVLGAIRHKISYTKQPTLALNSLGSSPEGDDYPYVWNLEGLLHLLDSHLTSLNERNKESHLLQQKSDYAKRIDEKIEESKQCAQRLKTYLDQALAAIDEEMGKILGQIERLKRKTEDNIEEIKKQITSLKWLAGFKIAFSIIQAALSIASVVCPAIAPLALVTKCLMNAATSIAEDCIKTGDVANLKIDFTNLSFNDTFQPDEALEATKAQLTELNEAKIEEEFNAAKSKYVAQEALERSNITVPNAFVESEELKQMRFETRTKEVAVLEKKVAKGEEELAEKAERWNKGADIATTTINEGVNVYNTIRSSLNDISEAEETQAKLEDDLKKLQGMLSGMNETRKAFDNMASDLNVAIGTYSDKSISELIMTSTEFIRKFNGLSGQFDKVKKAFQMESSLGEHIDTVKFLYSNMVDIYKQIAQYKDHKEFAGYVADLHIGDTDVDLSEIFGLLEANYLLTQQRDTMRALKAHLAMGHGVAAVEGDDPLAPDKLVKYIKTYRKFDKDAYAKHFGNVISGIKSIILRDGAFMTDKDTIIKCDAHQKTNAFTYATHRQFHETLMRGDSANISLPVADCPLDLFAVTKVNLCIEHEEAKLNTTLQRYLSDNMEAVLTRSGLSQFRLGDSFYDAPFSCPPTLTHYMNGNSGNKAMHKLRELSASPTLSPFGGLWEVRLKVANQGKSVNFLDPITLKVIFQDPDLTPLDFLKGLKVYLYFEGQCFDFHVDKKTEVKLPYMQDLLASLCLDLAENEKTKQS